MLYPINLILEDRHCLVIGGGNVAFRKIERLLQCQANVLVISKEFCSELTSMNHSRLKLEKKTFQDQDIHRETFMLIMAATDNRELNARISELCLKNNLLCNIADKPEYCSFYLPSICQTETLQIAVSTQGKSPGLSRFIRKWIEKLLPPGIDGFVKKVAAFRKETVKKPLTYDEKKSQVNKYITEEWNTLNES